MPDGRADSGVSRRWRLPALVTGITLVGGSAVLRSTVERLHNQVCEVRRLRARLAERRHEIDRQRRELAAVAAAVDDLVPEARVLGSRAMEVRETRAQEESGADRPEPAGTPGSRIEDGPAPGMHAIATLAWVEEQMAEASDAIAVQTVLARTRAQEARALPTLWPVWGAVSSPFGWRRSPYGGEPEWHPGIDISAAYGTPVRATADGDVVFAGRQRGYGVLVVVDHGATTTRYAHLSASWVHAGQRVLRGEPLGAVGRTGRTTAPHVHYEVRLGGEPLDPDCLLTGPARTTLAQSGRPSHGCALARAWLEGQRSPATARGAARATSSPAGAAS
jgi:murein DD-endopeptidase MepM/ murein hydrolase activator NlpD